MNLTEFLIQNPVDNITDTVLLKLKRDGKVHEWKFTIKAVTQDEFTEYQKQSMRVRKHGKPEFDSKKFNDLVVLNHTIEPDFKNAEFIKMLGVVTPSQAVNKTILSGEISELAEQIMSLSGFDQDLEEMKEEVKNY